LSTSRRPCTRSNYGPIAVQGLGAGAITSSVQIMLSDLVTLRERGTFSGLMALYVFLSLCPETLSSYTVALGQLAAVSVQ
jgi:MFS family permease